MKNTIILIIVIVIIGLGAYFLIPKSSSDVETDKETATTTDKEMVEKEEEKTETVIGTSVEGRDITAYHFGEGDREVLLVSGIHGGYSWNTALLGFEAKKYFESNEDTIPENVKVTVVPVLNPDGLYAVVGTAGEFSASSVPATEAETIPGRFNANDVDLNRNFDCDWQSSGTWQQRTVSGGASAFSEPESKAIRDYVNANNPSAVIVYYSAAGGVFASNCHNGILPETLLLTNTYAKASGYKAYESFDFYTITGDMVNWLASKEIPAISVLLTNHKDTEWSKNKAGIEAIIKNIAE